MYVISYQLKLIKMHAELANLNHCAVPFLSLATVILSWHESTTYSSPISISVYIYKSSEFEKDKE